MIYITKNNCDTVARYSNDKFKKVEELLKKDGYRKLNPDELKKYLAKSKEVDPINDLTEKKEKELAGEKKKK